MGIFVFDRDGHIVAFEEKPKPDRLAAIGRSVPEGATFAAHTDERPFMASMGIYVFSRQVLLDLLEHEPGHDFGRELIPRAMTRYNVQPYLFDGYWADVGTIGSFYEANVTLGPARRAVPLLGSGAADLHAPAASARVAAARLPGARVDPRRRLLSRSGAGRSVGRRPADQGALGHAHRPLGDPGRRLLRGRIRPRGCRRSASAATSCCAASIVDKNARIGDGARLTNERGVEEADGDGYYIRSGIVVVPKGGVIAPGTVV